ncbi:MAG: hypothetical protein ABI196_18725 [Bradyrhizobium sp.]
MQHHGGVARGIQESIEVVVRERDAAQFADTPDAARTTAHHQKPRRLGDPRHGRQQLGDRPADAEVLYAKDSHLLQIRFCRRRQAGGEHLLHQVFGNRHVGIAAVGSVVEDRRQLTLRGGIVSRRAWKTKPLFDQFSNHSLHLCLRSLQ